MSKCEFCGKNGKTASTMFNGEYCIECYETLIEFSREAIKEIKAQKEAPMFRAKKTHEYVETDWKIKNNKEIKYPISLCGIKGKIIDFQNWVYLRNLNGSELSHKEKSMARAKITCQKCIKIRKDIDFDRSCDCKAKHQNHANPSHSFGDRYS